MAIRTIDGPDADWLDMADLVRITTLSENTIRRMIKRGQFPEPHILGDGSKRWSWKDVVWFGLGVEMAGRLKVEESGEQFPATDRHRPPGGAKRQKSDSGP